MILRKSQEKFNMSDNNEDPKTGVALSDGPAHNPDLVLIRKEQAKRDFRGKTLLTPRLIPAFNDDGQDSLDKALAILCRSFRAGRILIFRPRVPLRSTLGF